MFDKENFFNANFARRVKKTKISRHGRPKDFFQGVRALENFS